VGVLLSATSIIGNQGAKAIDQDFSWCWLKSSSWVLPVARDQVAILAKRHSPILGVLRERSPILGALPQVERLAVSNPAILFVGFVIDFAHVEIVLVIPSGDFRAGGCSLHVLSV
jgi:hypothetical protein